MNLEVSTGATDEEVAAIVCAIEVLWPKPVLVDPTPVRRLPTWRFSNRWWIGPLASRRERPHR